MSQRRSVAGFTLIELVLVMGILSGFLLLLTRLLGAGVDVFEEGEQGQALADRAQAAANAVETELRALQGPRPAIEPGTLDARLLVQWLPHALVDRPPPTLSWNQVLRADAALTPDQERDLLQASLRSRAEQEVGEQGEAAVQARLQELLAATARQGRCGFWLLPWPTGDQDGAYLELRTARFLPGQLVEVGQDQFVDPMLVPLPGSAELPSAVVDRFTRVLLPDLLHFELRFWSQQTAAWSGAEVVWDSARGGWLQDPQQGPVFGLDLGPWSLGDATDDVYPHAVQCVLVVAQDPGLPAEGLLAADLEAGDQSLRLLAPDRFPGDPDGGYVKIGPEWLRYGALRGSELQGLQRGLRGSKPRAHPSGSRLRLGRTVSFTLPLPFAKDDWNTAGGPR